MVSQYSLSTAAQQGTSKHSSFKQRKGLLIAQLLCWEFGSLLAGGCGLGFPMRLQSRHLWGLQTPEYVGSVAKTDPLRAWQ